MSPELTTDQKGAIAETAIIHAAVKLGIAVRCYSSRRTPTGFVRTCYTPSEVDALAAYCPQLDRCSFLRLDALRATTTIQLRVAAARNGQRVNVNWAEQFEFAATLAAPSGP